MPEVKLYFDLDYLCKLAEEEASKHPRFFGQRLEPEWDEDYKRVIVAIPEDQDSRS